MSKNVSGSINDNSEQFEDNSHPEHGSGIDSNVFLPKLTDLLTTTELKASTFKSHWWAKSPKEGNFTDWSLDVKIKDIDNDEEAAVTTYSVHRSSLVQSDYFKPSFGGQFLESQQKRSKIEFPTPDITLDHFERLLDYFYSGEIILDSSNVIPILYLSNYLQVTQLEKFVQNHIRTTIEKLRCDSLFTFYKIAGRLQMENLKDAVAHICAQQPSFMMKDTCFATVPDNALWCSVWDSRRHDKDQIQKFTEQWSENLANYMDQHNSIVDHKMFSQLTDKALLPALSSDAAISLMEQEQKFCSKETGNTDTLTCLQKRAVASIYDKETGEWNIPNKQPNSLQTARKRLKVLPPVVLDSLLENAMSFKGKDTKVTSITVSGAEKECVNGAYKLAGQLFGNKPMFTRFDDQSNQQIMMFSGDGLGYRGVGMIFYKSTYYIAAVPKGEKPGADGSKKLYYCQKFDKKCENNDSFFPKVGWRELHDGGSGGSNYSSISTISLSTNN